MGGGEQRYSSLSCPVARLVASEGFNSLPGKSSFHKEEILFIGGIYAEYVSRKKSEEAAFKIAARETFLRKCSSPTGTD